MDIDNYKTAIKQIIDSTDNEVLLSHWEKQLRRDIEQSNEIELTSREWSLVEEGIEEYEKDEILSLEDFLNKRSSL